MAVILAPDDYATWLDPTQPRQASDRLLRPCPAGWLRGWRVSRAVSKAGSEGADLIAPVTESRGS
jgi:putative SOS response-associated peptidase YedK